MTARLSLKPVTSEKWDHGFFDHRCVSSARLSTWQRGDMQGWSFEDISKEKVFLGKGDCVSQALRRGTVWPLEERIRSPGWLALGTEGTGKESI